MKKTVNALKHKVMAVFLGCFLAILPMTISTASQEALYLVEDQLVDVTADDPVQAREKAIMEAQRMAFEVLAERMLAQDEQASMPNLSDEIISGLVKDFSVKDERIASNRYRASFTLRFDDMKVERIFGITGMAYSDLQSRPVIVLPFLQIGSRLMIWEEPNPWREIWQNAVLDDGLVPIRVPLGDISDMADVPDASVFSGQAGNLTSIASRYGAENVILAVAKSRGAALDASEGVLVTLYATSGQRIERLNELMIPAGVGATFSQAMNDVVAYIRNEWKQQTITMDALEANKINVQVSFDGLPQWVDIKQRLEGITVIEAINNDTMTHNGARLTVDYTGTFEGLRLAMAQNDLLLSQTAIDGVGYVIQLQETSYSY